MKICLKCQKEFPSYITIDNKLRNLANRKYCFECSPFGLHNTRKIHYVKTSKTLTCNVCSREYLYKKNKGHTLLICSSCKATEKVLNRKQKMVNHLGNKCQKCGYHKNLAALCFHHKIPSEKEFGLNSSYRCSWERVVQELKKCELLCIRCHMEIHNPKFETSLLDSY